MRISTTLIQPVFETRQCVNWKKCHPTNYGCSCSTPFWFDPCNWINQSTNQSINQIRRRCIGGRKFQWQNLTGLDVKKIQSLFMQSESSMKVRLSFSTYRCARLKCVSLRHSRLITTDFQVWLKKGLPSQTPVRFGNWFVMKNLADICRVKANMSMREFFPYATLFGNDAQTQPVKPEP